jgi:hypothetical protein
MTRDEFLKQEHAAVARFTREASQEHAQYWNQERAPQTLVGISREYKCQCGFTTTKPQIIHDHKCKAKD